LLQAQLEHHDVGVVNGGFGRLGIELGKVAPMQRGRCRKRRNLYDQALQVTVDVAGKIDR
jgi:hypothetical protein